MIDVGDRVELSPAYDLWMRGARFGTVKQIHNDVAYVEMDHPQVKRRQKIPLADLRPVRPLGTITLKREVTDNDMEFVDWMMHQAERE